MPPYVLTDPASREFLPGVPSCLSAFVLIFPFAPSAMFLATFGGPVGALPTHEKCAHRLLQENEWDELKVMVLRDVTKTAWYHGHVGIHLLEEMVRHADMDMDDWEAMIGYNVMTTVRRHKSGMDESHVTIRGYNVMSTDHPDGHV
ncbi:hypothetical protein Syun_027896 [Stephania yunnanensis]|uniref:Uncharacterized protein n=1 Tax=Stephania yunnanensis TaxID=152371 RepID=A0AAP0HRN6_9MAGN